MTIFGEDIKVLQATKDDGQGGQIYNQNGGFDGDEFDAEFNLFPPLTPEQAKVAGTDYATFYIGDRPNTQRETNPASGNLSGYRVRAGIGYTVDPLPTGDDTGDASDGDHDDDRFKLEAWMLTVGGVRWNPLGPKVLPTKRAADETIAGTAAFIKKDLIRGVQDGGVKSNTMPVTVDTCPKGNETDSAGNTQVATNSAYPSPRNTGNIFQLGLGQTDFEVGNTTVWAFVIKRTWEADPDNSRAATNVQIRVNVEFATRR